jgi:hypothetical protein
MTGSRNADVDGICRQPGCNRRSMDRDGWCGYHDPEVQRRRQATRTRNAAAARSSSAVRSRRSRAERRLSRTLGGIRVEYHLHPELGHHDGYLIRRYDAERWLEAHDPGRISPQRDETA